MINKGWALLVWLAVACGSCTPVGIDNNKLPGINISISEMNIAFRIDDPPAVKNSHKNDEILTLQAKNLSDIPIIFPGDLGLKIFRKQDKDWIRVDNLMHSPVGEITLATNNDFPPGVVVMVIPYIPTIQTPETIRIVLVGHKSDSPSDLVGAYIDILLSP